MKSLTFELLDGQETAAALQTLSRFRDYRDAMRKRGSPENRSEYEAWCLPRPAPEEHSGLKIKHVLAALSAVLRFEGRRLSADQIMEEAGGEWANICKWCDFAVHALMPAALPGSSPADGASGQGAADEGG